VLVVAACSRPVVVGTPAPTVPAVQAPNIASASDLVTQMHDRYAGSWYRNLTFVQTSTYYKADGTVSQTQTWYEAGAMPGRLRIDIGSPAQGNGVVFANDSVYQFQNGRVASARKGRNELMILGFDVYAQAPERTLAMLRDEGFDTSRFHEATANGQRYYVVGAAAGDTTHRQFWVDADRLLFWRVIEPWSPTDTTHRREIRFENYVQRGGGWVAERVDMLRDGQRIFLETYADVQVNQDLDAGLWDPQRFTTARHWRVNP